MLPKQHRLRRADELRRVARTGRRRAGATLVTHVLATELGAPARFGFIVSKAVGGAATRNLVKRRLRAIAAERLRSGLSAADVVVRAMPAAATARYAELEAELGAQLGTTSSQAVTA